MKTVALCGKKGTGRVSLVDDENWDLVMSHKWRLQERLPRGARRVNGPYAITSIIRDGKWTSLYMHVLIMGVRGIDHIDHDGLNNQRSNLRIATDAQNMHNKRAWLNSKSRYKGVTWHCQRNKWFARLDQRSLGLFVTEAAAALAYNVAALEAYGPYACLNDVESDVAPESQTVP